MCCCLSKNVPARGFKRVLQSSRGRALISLTPDPWPVGLCAGVRITSR